MKIPFRIALIAISFLALSKFTNTKTHGFSYLNFTILPPKSYEISFENPPETLNILKQPFSFLDSGGESLVFESKDQKWVLKVFKKHRLYPFYQLQALDLIPFLKKNLTQRSLIYSRFWESLKIQSEELSTLSGLYFVHQPQKNEPDIMMCLKDPLGSTHSLNFKDIYFILQKKGSLFQDIYKKQDSLQLRQQMLLKLVAFYKQLDQKGFKIWDNAIKRNIGWIDEHPFLIDTGAVCKKNPDESFEDQLKSLKNWIIKNDPVQLDFILDAIATK
jgi:hypothetical protein